MMDALDDVTVKLLTSDFGQVLKWGIPELIFAVIAILAAKRHKLPGMGLLAVAAGLLFFHRISLTLVAAQFGKAANTSNVHWGSILAALHFYPPVLILLIAIAGAVMLAFCRSPKTTVAS